MNDSRKKDFEIAEKVLGLKKVVIQPDWYKTEVTLFIDEEADLVVYSYDDNACNAMMFRNGKDDAQGVAESLPYFYTELEDTMTLITTEEQENLAKKICDRLLESSRTKTNEV